MMVLSRVDAGKKVIIQDIHGGRGIRSKLNSMGLIPGAKLTVLRGNCAGPTMIAVKDSRLAIGRGMAQKIIVG
ncbi:MAG: ferrous iron transport protein A [Desulfobacteraceae bacterium]|nr:MAG: ferrous iron transport protein A [Desulfobacteraceae bacterium]